MVCRQQFARLANNRYWRSMDRLTGEIWRSVKKTFFVENGKTSEFAWNTPLSDVSMTMLIGSMLTFCNNGPAYSILEPIYNSAFRITRCL